MNHEQNTYAQTSVLPAEPQEALNEKKSSDTLAKAAFYTGVGAFIVSLMPIINVLVGTTAVLLGALSLKKRQHKGFAITGISLGVIAILAMFAPMSDDRLSVNEVTTNKTVLEKKTQENAKPEPKPAPEPKPEPDPEPESEPDELFEPSPEPAYVAQPEPAPVQQEPSISMGQSNAIDQARSYLSFMPFSRSGLISQLEYEGYSYSDAEYAVDNISVDWHSQAARSAKHYIDFTPFSYSGLIEQLEYEGYTYDQAEHGVNTGSFDWFTQAERSAKNYLDFMSFSREGLIDQLLYEGYSYEQASHGVTAAGY